MIRGGDGNRIDGFVLEKLADIHKRRGLGDAVLRHRGDALPHEVLVDVADGGDFDVRKLRVIMHVIHAAPVHATNRHAHANRWRRRLVPAASRK